MNVKNILKFILLFLLLMTFFSLNLPAQGHFEFGVHYSSWSIDVLRAFIEEGIGNALENDLKDKFLEDLRQDYPSMVETSYEQDISFDSGGHNYGVEIRWYPQGENGSFSLGISVEKTYMRVSLPQLAASMSLRDQDTDKAATFQGKVDGAKLEMDPLSFHLSFRWDINPSWRVRPYITFGVGAATGAALKEATYSFSYSGKLNIEGEKPEVYEGSDSKTLQQLKEEIEEEEEFFLPSFLPFIQLNFGLKGEITKNLYLLVDAGLWNGFLIRGGTAVRF